MPEDKDMPWEYRDDEEWHPRMSVEDEQLFKELNKLRYRHNNGWLSDERFFSEIDCIEFIGWLSDYEQCEIDRRNREKQLKKEQIEKDKNRRRVEKELAKKEFNDGFGCFVIILFLLAILWGILSGIFDKT